MECERERERDRTPRFMVWATEGRVLGHSWWADDVEHWDLCLGHFKFEIPIQQRSRTRKLKDMKRLELPGEDGTGGVNSGVIILRRYWSPRVGWRRQRSEHRQQKRRWPRTKLYRQRGQVGEGETHKEPKVWEENTLSMWPWEAREQSLPRRKRVSSTKSYRQASRPVKAAGRSAGDCADWQEERRPEGHARKRDTGGCILFNAIPFSVSNSPMPKNKWNKKEIRLIPYTCHMSFSSKSVTCFEVFVKSTGDLGLRRVH